MFDIGFWELAVIGVIALIVVGPEEFPTLVRSFTNGVAKIRQFLSAVKSDMDFEIDRVEEIKRLVEKEAKLAEMEELVKDLGSSVSVDNPNLAVKPESAPDSRGQNNELEKQRSAEDPAKKHPAGSSNGAD